MGICCVEGCETDGDEVVYFPVPVAATLRRKWRSAVDAAVGSSCKLHPDSRICSRHFAETDYERVRGKLRLKARVVPSLFSSDCSIKKVNSSPISKRTRKSQHRDASERETGDESSRDGNSTPHDQETQDCASLCAPELGSPRPEGDDSGVCTIECVPEAILNHDIDSHSDTELPKEDIEDIIANYHIQHHRRTETEHAGASETADNGCKERQADSNGLGEKGTEDRDTHSEAKQKERDKTSEEKDKSRTEEPPDRAKEKEDAADRDGAITIEIEAEPIEKPPEFIEISVGAGRKRLSTNNDDCLMLLEKVQVDVDPATFLLPQDDDDDRREDPISLLTSSDDSDVIIEEPHIDTVEVSSEDEDDKPLVALVKKKHKPTKLSQLLWGNLTEYYCYQCKFTTLSKSELERHKLEHSKILMVCEICNYTSGNKSHMVRHKKKHKEEKKYKCNHCEYRARHNMSLVYHMKSHEGVAEEEIQAQTILTLSGRYKCGRCRFTGSSRKAVAKHTRTCHRGSYTHTLTTHKCAQCAYTTKRRNDLKRHIERRHAEIDD